jgi:hypothetical protein
MQVTVTHVNIPAWSTLGYGEGFGPNGETVTFAGDHRPMRDLGEAVHAATSREDLPVVDLEDTQIIGINPATV